jgi:hypothetical protein
MTTASPDQHQPGRGDTLYRFSFVPRAAPTAPGRPPLWQEMQEAVIAAPLATHDPAGTVAAAQIRAVRDYIRAHVPGHGWQTWQVRQIVDLLNDEADRAERGT